MAVQTQIQVRRGTAATWTSTNPTLAAGEIGFESDTGKIKVGTGSATWNSLTYIGAANAIQYVYNASAGQTTFSGADANGATLAYTVGAEQVYVNGVLQVRNTDYTATNGTSVVLTTATIASDIVTVVALGTFTVADTYTQAQANAKFIIGASDSSAGKNAIINGGFDIWQRGTSSSTNANYGSADRWWLYYAAGTCTVSQETSIVPTGLRYAAKLTQSVASTTNLQWNQAIETANAVQFAGQTVTLSGYVAASASTSIYITLNYSTSTDVANSGAWTALTPTSGSNTVTVGTTTYVRISAQYAIPSTAKSLQVQMGTSSIASGTSIYFSGVQLELGSVATAFARNASTIQGELAACQRYYYRASYTDGQMIAGGQAFSATGLYGSPVSFPVTMRTIPSAAVSNATHFKVLNASAGAFLTSSAVTPDRTIYGFNFNTMTVASGLTAGNAVIIFSNNAGCYVEMSAEL